MKERFADILKSRIAVSNLSYRVLPEEPRLEEYFARLDPPPDPPNQIGLNYFNSSQFDARGFNNGVKVRADLVVSNITNPDENLIIDFTFVEPTAQTYVGTYNKQVKRHLRGKKIKSAKSTSTGKLVATKLQTISKSLPLKLSV